MAELSYAELRPSGAAGFTQATLGQLIQENDMNLDPIDWHCLSDSIPPLLSRENVGGGDSSQSWPPPPQPEDYYENAGDPADALQNELDFQFCVPIQHFPSSALYVGGLGGSRSSMTTDEGYSGSPTNSQPSLQISNSTGCSSTAVTTTGTFYPPPPPLRRSSNSFYGFSSEQLPDYSHYHQPTSMYRELFEQPLLATLASRDPPPLITRQQSLPFVVETVEADGVFAAKISQKPIKVEKNFYPDQSTGRLAGESSASGILVQMPAERKTAATPEEKDVPKPCESSSSAAAAVAAQPNTTRPYLFRRSSQSKDATHSSAGSAAVRETKQEMDDDKSQCSMTSSEDEDEEEEEEEEEDSDDSDHQYSPTQERATSKVIKDFSGGSRPIHSAHSPQLWEFLMMLLDDPKRRSVIGWRNKDEGVFKIFCSDAAARLWGSYKNRSNMNYDKMSRAMRYYYGKGIFEKVPGRLVYKFSQSARQKYAASAIAAAKASTQALKSITVVAAATAKTTKKRQNQKNTRRRRLRKGLSDVD
ncbi:uncharacterized protein [Oscarella lobularis]|uniref:uncharacterized protein isoform X2 n=1 Tax=Oscarella lobularis TaxID=121494 RepID=UPI0033141769